MLTPPKPRNKHDNPRPWVSIWIYSLQDPESLKKPPMLSPTLQILDQMSWNKIHACSPIILMSSLCCKALSYVVQADVGE